MKICVLIPSEDYRQQAGARIRYGRTSPRLDELGHELTLQEIGTFDPRHSDHDVHLISKCYDARALICATVLRDRGKIVGVDLFDDYFSQFADSRFVRFRSWLSRLLDLADFAMCSTPTMTSVVRSYREDLPVHVMNDPAPEKRPADIEAVLDRKLADAHDSRTLKLAWFGIGDNPYFPVGLSDLAAFGGVLNQLRFSGWTVKLKILTNARALTAAGLVQIQRLAVPFEIEEWSEIGEQAALDESLISLIPVNGQNFSIAKSLNRAISGLTHGCQILSAGYPLYDALAPLVYRDIDELIGDLSARHLKFRKETVPVYNERMAELASSGSEAQKLSAFLQQVVRSNASTDGVTPRNIAVLHGVTTNGAVHALAQRIGALSVASPFCGARLHYDAIFQPSEVGHLTLYVGERALDRLKSDFKKNGTPTIVHDHRYWRASSAPTPASGSDRFLTAPTIGVSSYTPVMDRMQDMIADVFGPCRFILSELSHFPLTVQAKA